MNLKDILIIRFLFLLIGTGFLNVNSLYSYPEFNINGYFYNFLSVQKIPSSLDFLVDSNERDDAFIVNLAKIRLRPELNISENTRIEAHLELSALYSDKMNVINPVEEPPNKRQLYNLSETWNEGDVSYKFVTDRLFFKHQLDFAELIVGRQRISWGVGRIWQPTDLFNPINPANFSKFEKDGADALDLRYYLGDLSDLEIVYNFTSAEFDNNFGARFRTNVEGYDFSIMTGYFDKRYVGGLDIAGSLLDAGLRAEAVVSFDKDRFESNYYMFILGADYQFNDKLYALVEYQFNGKGTNCKYCYDMLALLKGEVLNVGQNYIAAMLSYLVHPLVNTNTTIIQNIADGSGLINAGAKYNPLENINVGLNFGIFYGSKYSEYSYYSNSIFLTIDYYF